MSMKNTLALHAVKKITSLSLLTAASLLSFGAQAVVVTQWNFNATSGTLVASTGTGAASVVGGIAGSFAGGGEAVGTVNDKAWQTTTYAAQGADNLSKGVQFTISTLGFEDIVFSYDNRLSATASANVMVQYSLDGANFTDAQLVTSPTALVFAHNVIDLSAVSAIDNQASVTLRIVSAFKPTTSQYATTATGGGAYAPGGTMRYDLVTVEGSAVAAVPEPQTYAMLLAGLAAVGFVARRRKAS
ncbi:PEP-CTERM sorting domain-containing protein [Paucibacter sp. AS339]|uniref:PEP-CTERM sorting domain-containing protein n=1 Tax=Paucibacter hankyongi TaxID=3133434 RepID=UPI0030A6EB3F